MRLDKIFETSQPGLTTVETLGSLKFFARPNYVKIMKKHEDEEHCIAKMVRYKKSGWRFIQMPKWCELNLPHVGYMHGAKVPVSGKKTIASSMNALFKKWGLSVEEIRNAEEI